MPFTVALIGRPNVGKSTLFNRLVGRREALVSEIPGLTRDRREGDAELSGMHFRVVDTAGLEEAAAETLTARMYRQSAAAAEEADLCLFLIDARAGITEADRQFAVMLRRGPAPVVLVANKCEGRAGREGAYEAYELGLGDPVAISAEHGEAIGDLAGAIRPFFEEWSERTVGGEIERDEGKALRLVVLGRPNAGKSTLVNRLIGRERMLTGAEAGITRDAIAIDWEWRGRPVRLYDTAGLRRRARVSEAPEHLARTDALKAVRYAEVVVLLIDAQQPLDKQDLQLADLVADEGRALVIAANKIDLLADPRGFEQGLRIAVDENLAQVRGAPVVALSALQGKGLDSLMKAVFDTYEVWNRRIATGELNRWFAGVVDRHPPPAISGRRVRLRYLTQASSRPPTFVAFSSRPDAVPESYRRYIVNELRKAFDLPGVPVRLHLRKGRNPYAKPR